MKVYRVDVNGNSKHIETPRLVQAGSRSLAISHVMKVVNVRVATQDDLLLAVAGKVPIEVVKDDD
jgi:hypothetical protein